MRFSYLTLLSGLLISAVAIFYSVAGLASIFSAAVIPIIIMGISLELAKLVATAWLKKHWTVAPAFLKIYLTIAVVVLMLITSMGIFGYLSKAHSDQALVSGDIQAKLAIYDQKIQTEKDNIDADRKALQQMDTVVDQTMGRTTTAAGTSSAVSIRRSQKSERARVTKDIEAQQKTISDLMEASTPIRAQSRKAEAEVGPIKYVAALIYGSNPSQDLLESAVRWIIILLVIVFDPLAVCLLLASQYSFDLEKLKPEEIEEEDDFVETFLDLKGTVDPDIDLEADVPIDLHIQGDIDRIEAENIQDHMESIEDTVAESEVKITHTENSMIIEDSAGMQEIPASEVPVTYVQNEEQAESSKWTNILKPISEGEYLEAARQRRKSADDQ
jgi:hypothetical protein